MDAKWKVGIPLVALAVIVGALHFNGGIDFQPGEFQGGDNPDKNLTEPPAQTEDRISVLDAGTTGEVTLPVAATNAKVLLVKDSVGIEEDTGNPVHFGDYVDFSLSDAKSGLTADVDYREASLSSSKTASFSNLEPGTYDIVLVDEAGTREYHYYFGEVTMPETISKWKAENNNVVELTRNQDSPSREKIVNFDRFPSYDTDSVSVFAPGGEIKQADDTAGTVDLKNPSENVTDRVRTIERAFTYNSGQDYLGKVVVNNLNTGDGISIIECTVTVDGDEQFSKTLLDGSTDEFGSDNAFSEQLVSDPQENPVKAGSRVEVECTVTYDYNTLAESADDSQISDGEAMFDFKLEDIYGNVAGADGASSVTG